MGEGKSCFPSRCNGELAPLISSKSRLDINVKKQLFVGATDASAQTEYSTDPVIRKQMAFQAGIAVCVTAYGENEEEIANNLKTFDGKTSCNIHLSIMLDGHSTEEKRRTSAVFQAYKKLLIDPYGEGCVEEYDCVVYYGRRQDVNWRLYVKGASLPRGQHNSHKTFYFILDDRVARGLEAMPTAWMHMDADTGSPNGVTDLERLLVMLLENPNTACVAPGIRPLHPFKNLCTAHQIFDMSILKFLFSWESAFAASQVAMGMSYMCRANLFTNRSANKPDSVLDEYMYYDGDHPLDFINPPSINQDAWSAYFVLRAGYGMMCAPNVSFYTTPPDNWVEYIAQRRRWYSGTMSLVYQWYDPWQTPWMFFTFYRFRILMWLLMGPGCIYFLWLGLGLTAYNTSVLVTFFSAVMMNKIDYWKNPALTPVFQYSMIGFWVFILLWVVVVVDREPKDLKAFVNFYVYLTVLINAGVYVLGLYNCYGGVQTHQIGYADVGVAFQSYLLPLLVYPLIGQTLIQGIRYWPTLICGFFASLFTGTACFNINFPQVHTLIWVYGFCSTDSGSWGTHASDATSGFSDKYVQQKFWRKIKKWIWFTLYLAGNLCVSYGFTYIDNFAAIYWYPLTGIGSLYKYVFGSFAPYYSALLFFLFTGGNTLTCLYTTEILAPRYRERSKALKQV